ncbi:MAG: competence/damage-inducible protein A [Prolixibacteraceae bacterium]|jgi:nicotinamide-nucleotide amidase|nr:competence/damage-inducible protein A [Prolixibacteraceae bacterium]
MNLDIITIGDEILIGQIVDTNSAWMAQKLNDEGINVRQIISISDDPDHITETFIESARKVDLVIVTGGLGPTKDDKTKDTICDFFGTKLVANADVLENIEELLSKRGIALNRLNRDQALVPEGSHVFQNKLGTAPGLLLRKNGCSFIFMPGVPYEMKYLMEFEVLPYLRNNFQTTTILHRTVLTQGLPESMLAEKIADWEDALPGFIKLAYLPSPQGVRLRLSARGMEQALMEAEVASQITGLQKLIAPNIYGYNDESPAESIGKLLTEKGWTVSTAESCTGGAIAKLFTENPGSSDYFKGSVVAYSNEIKKDILGVKEELLNQHGAVSREVVESMALNGCRVMKTDFAIATSGIAGPGGGTEEKPVGTVWIAVAFRDQVVSQLFNFGNDRERNITRTSQNSLFMLRKLLITL